MEKTASESGAHGTPRLIPLPTPLEGEPCAIALGLFDGCHLGHRALLRQTVALAEGEGLLPAVFTFADGEAKNGAPEITNFAQRLSLFGEMGIKLVYAAPFRALRELTPELFAQNVLLRMCGAKIAVCGPDFRFGKGAEGTADTLGILARRGGCRCRVVPHVTDMGEKISSGAIRRALRDGDVERAARMLGAPFSLTLPVAHGKELGRTLGYPTANMLLPPGRALPRNGVYRTETVLEEGVFPSLTNVGLRPTVESAEEHNAETHLIGYSGDLYGREITVRFLAYLRPERRFDTLAALKEQLARDVAQWTPERTK